jgi:hypothetical protein
VSGWPFSSAELTAGLRRYFAEPALQVLGWREQPLPFAHHSDRAAGRVRGLHVDYAVDPSTLSVECVLKEPQGGTPAGLAGAGRREVGLYRSLAPQLPMPVPALVAAHPAGDWLVLETVEPEVAPAQWSADHYHAGVRTLAALHERFWNLGDDLAAYPWLGRPVTSDFEVHVHGAAQSLAAIIRDQRPGLLAGSTETLTALGQIISQADRVVEPLRLAPHSLLHGDFWPGNVALQSDGEMVVYDWKLVSVGPVQLDVVALLTSSRWELGALPLAGSEILSLYRQELAQRVHIGWSEDEWALAWDHALLWRFVQTMLGWAAEAPPLVFEARAQAFVDLWLEPVLAAARRRLAPILAF